MLVDELAHTNAPGSRHPKRYLDVEELLAAGIDVYATLNIQHVESLNDVVARITRIRVRETVPDAVIERADEIELIDLTPEDLIQRLKDGKVYVPAQAERAVRHYFAPGNLTALRELALRRTAQRVDNQMVDYMRTHAIEGPWPAGDRVLVCVQGGPKATATVRHAKRLADQLRAPWTAINVETTRATVPEAGQRRGRAAARRTAGRGAGADPRPGRRRHRHRLRPGEQRHAPDRRQIGPGGLAAVPAGLDHPAADQPRRRHQHPHHRGPRRTPRGTPAPADRRAKPQPSIPNPTPSPPVSRCSRPRRHGPAPEWLAVTNVALVFLTAVLIGAVLEGLGPSLLACFVAVLAYNFFFLPPLYTFTIADPENVVALFFFLVVAVIASNLAARVRGQALSARLRARQTSDLYQFSRKLAVAVTLDDLLWATVHQIAMMLKVRVVLLLPENGSIEVRAGFPPEDLLDDADLAAAKWSWEKNHIAGRGSDTLPGGKWLFQPLRTGRGPLGVVGIIRDDPGPLLTPDQQRLLDALADQAALAIERVNLARDLHLARLEVETDRLRAALLTSISHDLRTPLASILGSASSLRSQDAILDTATKDSLLGTIIEESDRLNRFIGNLLDMTRLESGRPEAAHQPERALRRGRRGVLRRASKILAAHRIEVDLPADLPMLVAWTWCCSSRCCSTCWTTPPDTRRRAALITIQASHDADTQVTLRVMDEGEGIPAADTERIFEKFYRAGGPDRRRAGPGLGLAICRGFVEAMDGTISAANRPDRPGAMFVITLPVPVNALLPEEETTP